MQKPRFGKELFVGRSVGSVCSGIEAASVAWVPLGFEFSWFSEIADFPSKLLAARYPDVPNLGNMRGIAELIADDQVDAPDIICGGTPCQAFSFAGWQKGLNDDRGNLTLEFVDIVNSNDSARERAKKDPCLVFWENVVGVLSDKTNAFGCFISSLAGLKSALPLPEKRWPSAGLLRGPVRTVAWRVLDAKYFGIPQQRKRLYVMAGPMSASIESIIFEEGIDIPPDEIGYTNIDPSFCFRKDGSSFEVFREYTDCLYSSYATKWNGNAAAFNGSLFVAQDAQLRRLSPLECERLMGFPDNYTAICGAKKTNRYQAIGNSWAVPVVKWFGERLRCGHHFSGGQSISFEHEDDIEYHDFSRGYFFLSDGTRVNCSDRPTHPTLGKMQEIVTAADVPDVFLSPVGCAGILRRQEDRNANINRRLEELLKVTSSLMSHEEIEKRSRIQKRGRSQREGGRNDISL
ncbi:MAG: restriction endonuclease subunit M [Adlercreutzia caecimuris]|jgi:DNA (cytosine-5)-methyltransferase 1|nr:restriction endonuclease subunit M [Adlercreutzia caecimuris]